MRDYLLDRWEQPFLGLSAAGLPNVYNGKVRDSYLLDRKRLLVTTDRVSAFDCVLGAIPYKGQVLNQLTNWWFEKTRDIVPNHLLSEVQAQSSLVKEAQPIRIEVVVRAYLTGSSKTALWTLYEKGEESRYGLNLPAGLEKNTKLEQPIVTPTTKDESDSPLASEQILELGLADETLWKRIHETALKLFERGTELAKKAGLVLVDTKYEFGLCEGELTLIDEIHTPDSSRYWLAGTEQQQAPRHQDKEVLRLWLVEQGFRGDGEPPVIPQDLALRLAEHYIDTFERLTETEFKPAPAPTVAIFEGVSL